MENEKIHMPPFYANMPDSESMIINTGNREFPFPELTGGQSVSKVELKIGDAKDAELCLSIIFGYGFLFRNGREDEEGAILLDIHPLNLDGGRYGVTKKA